jgi:nicotinamide-nucleotide amidase
VVAAILAGVPEPHDTAAIVTVGSEITSGDVENTNASWLARELAGLGVTVELVAAVRDDVGAIARVIRTQRGSVDHLLVTGGLGGTPDDVTREGVAAAFGVACAVDEAAAAPIRERFGRLGEYALRWATLPVGCDPFENPLGGAPGFVIGNVCVLPGVPEEMRACFGQLARRFRGIPILQERLAYDLAESDIVVALTAFGDRYPTLEVGSYPRFDGGRAQVELVVKGDDASLLRTASNWLADEVARLTR